VAFTGGTRLSEGFVNQAYALSIRTVARKDPALKVPPGTCR